MLSGFDSTPFPGNDDGTQGPVDLGFSINFLGSTFSQVYVNNNGNVTFGQGSNQFTPTALTNSGQLPRIAAFFADIDTRSSNPAAYGTGTVDGHAAFGVTWNGVGYYNNHDDKTNKLQLELIDREDRGTNDFDIEFNYDQIQWETGDSSGGSGGLGGTAARLGYTNGSGNAGTYFELSGATGSLLDSSISTGLIHQHFNSDIDGQFVFFVHSGEVVSSPLPFNLSISGAINAANPTNDWSFFGRADQSVSVNVHTGTNGSPPSPLAPTLNFAQLELLDSSGTVIATATNDTAGSDVSLAGITLPANDTYRIRVSAPPDHTDSVGNYTILAGDATVHTSPLELESVTHGQIFSPFAVDRWTFTGTANQQLQFNLIAAQSPSIQFDLTGPGGVTLFSNISASSDLLNLPSSGQYVLTAHSGNGQSGAYTFSINQVAITQLTLGTPFNGILLAPGQLQLFKFDVAAGNPLLVQLNDLTGSDVNDVFIRRGTPPTRGVYDYRSTELTADQNVQVPFATPGTWYVLVYARSLANPSTFTLLAKTSPLFLNSVSPSSFATNQTADVTLNGSGFLPGTTVDLLSAGGTVIATAQAVQINSFSQVTATFNLTGVATGTYGLRATLPGGASATLAGAFQVLPAGQAHLETNIILPGVVGRHATSTIYVEYANTGTAAMPAPILTLESADPDGSDMPLLTLDQSKLVEGLWTSALPAGFSHSIQIYASGAIPGVLLPGERIRVPVYYAGLQQPWDFSDTNVEFEVKVHDAGSTDPIDWAGLKSQLQPSWIPSDAWNAVFANLTNQIGSTYGDYVDMLGTNAVYLNRLGMNVTNVNDLFSFEVQQ
ncbi:MAG: repeat protein, partial [Planctomycetaceae bacterium]|nr:repeat protein [Planctomycetaceae bacterium]